MNGYTQKSCAVRFKALTTLLVSMFPVLLSAQNPFGSLDCPSSTNSNCPASGLSGAVNVTGWALSSYAVAKVSIYRDPLNGETPGSNGLVYIQDASFVAGARPDVAATYPNYPNNNWGFGTQLLTNMLPDSNGDGGRGNGTYRLHAIAYDPQSRNTDFGQVSISVDNRDSVLPFGTIDTPAQGGTASGTGYVNYGWALAPQPYNIPTSGSTITVMIDGQSLGHPTYNQYRSDIATLFPGLQNSNGAVGFSYIDWTPYVPTSYYYPALHTISWVVQDNVGHQQGIGSRWITVPRACDGAPCNQYNNSYWPMSVGNKWTFMNSTTHSPAVITIQPSPVTFGCAQSPVPVTIYKLDPNNYWSPTFQADLTWFLGIRPNLDLIGFGHLWNDFSGNPVYGTNFYITQPGYDPDANPQYILMRAGGPNATAPLITQQYFGNALNPDYNCETPPPPPYSSSGTWQANWSSTSVSTPGYAGTAMVATYGESNVSAHETWYYAQNIGPVQIVNTAGLTLQLVEHSTGAVSPKVAFRDILITQAAATAGLNFDQWNYYLAQVTHIAVPAPQEVCMDPSLRGNPLTVDQYLSYLTNRGTSCSSVHWNMTELQDVQNRAGVTDGLTYDQWNYYDSQAGYAAYDVTQVCMRSETYCDHQGGTSQSTCDPDQNNVPQGTINTIFPNRYATYSSAQWFSLVGYVRAGGVCQ